MHRSSRKQHRAAGRRRGRALATPAQRRARWRRQRQGAAEQADEVVQDASSPTGIAQVSLPAVLWLAQCGNGRLAQSRDAYEFDAAMSSIGSPLPCCAARSPARSRAVPPRAAAGQAMHRPQLAGQADLATRTVPGMSGRSRSADASARASGRSMRRLLDAEPADDARVDVVAGKVHARATAENGDEQRQSLRVEAGSGAPRRPVDLRRDERLDLDEQRAAALEGGGDGDARRAERLAARGTRAPGRPPRAGRRRPSRSTPTSSVEPKRFLAERSRRSPQKRSPSSVSTTSTMCSSVLGPASVPSLVTWPTRTTGTPFSLA